MKHFSRKKLGAVEQKILLLLLGGLSLGLTRSRTGSMRIMREIGREWKKINQRSLREAINNLYRSHMINFKEQTDGTVTMLLESDGKKRALTYNLETMKLPKPARWDGGWRIILFDIPESLKKNRDAFAARLKILGTVALQKSVFVYPHNCRDEIEFIAEVLQIRPYVRFILAKEIDNAPDIKDQFNLL